MDIGITLSQLTNLGLSSSSAQKLLMHFKAQYQIANSAAQIWQQTIPYLLQHHFPFEVHLFLFNSLFPNWHTHPELAPAWLPSVTSLSMANLSKLMAEKKINDVRSFHQWSVENYQEFWHTMLKELKIIFHSPPSQLCDFSRGFENPEWLPDAKLNIAENCFTADPNKIAIIETNENNQLSTLTYKELDQLSNCIANSLVTHGYKKNDAIAIIMPMHSHAVALYLGIIKMGGVVVSIPDSFSSTEIAVRLEIAKTKAIFTQDILLRDHKEIKLYEKIASIDLKEIAVIVLSQSNWIPKRNIDLSWQDFILTNTQFTPISCAPMEACNILFSSGTTADPKAIAWNHTTAIKAATDGFLHQDIKPEDVLSWPTNLGWMMGPWALFATLINKATLALYTDVPKNREFGEFIQKARITILGVVPTLVSTWRQTKCMEDLNWGAIKLFSSTGECSNPEDMLYLMYLAGYKPIIEYCGGTEIGGAYVSSTIIEANYPSLFSTPTFGLDFLILNEQGKPASIGEVAIIPPSLGLSTGILNADHHQIYFAGMPLGPNNKILRRHGDLIEQLSNGYYMMLGRADDAMNLGGIKISAAEIERAIVGIPHVQETAAVAVMNQNGPAHLVIFAVTTKSLLKEELKKEMQKRINLSLNPLFKIYDIIFMDSLPKTASNKIMRRSLRKNYQTV